MANSDFFVIDSPRPRLDLSSSMDGTRDTAPFELCNYKDCPVYVRFHGFHCCDVNLQGQAPDLSKLLPGERRRFFITASEADDAFPPDMGRRAEYISGSIFVDWDVYIFFKDPGTAGCNSLANTRETMSCKIKFRPDALVGLMLILGIEEDELDEPLHSRRRVRDPPEGDDDDDDEAANDGCDIFYLEGDAPPEDASQFFDSEAQEKDGGSSDDDGDDSNAQREADEAFISYSSTEEDHTDDAD
jgi:hypothetical protein